MGEVPWGSQGPARKRAAEAEKFRRRRNSAKTSFLSSGQLGLDYPQYIAAGEIAGARNNFGGLGAMLTN